MLILSIFLDRSFDSIRMDFIFYLKKGKFSHRQSRLHRMSASRNVSAYVYLHRMDVSIIWSIENFRGRQNRY